MTYWENVWSRETANFVVEYDVAPEDDLDISWDDDGEVQAGLDSGKYVAFQARVRVRLKSGGTIGVDYLGNCIYESAKDFIKGSGYFLDMLATACAEARKSLLVTKSIKVRAT